MIEKLLIIAAFFGFSILLLYVEEWINEFKWKRETKNHKKQNNEIIKTPTTTALTNELSDLDPKNRKTQNAINLLYISYGKDYVNSLSEKDFKELVAESIKILDSDTKKKTI
jgi:hypothetical protein